MRRTIMPVWAALVLASVARAEDTGFDGRWWLSVSRDQQPGYVSGYIDCSIPELRRREFSGVSWYTLQPLVTDYYRASKSRLARPVAAVSSELAAPLSPLFAKATNKAPPRVQHGAQDGEWWRQMPPSWRTGFIEGHLSCRSELPGSEPRFKTAPEIVRALNRWYGIDPNDPSEINPKRHYDVIGDVLLREGILPEPASPSSEVRSK